MGGFAGDGPEEAGEFARDGGRDRALRLAGEAELAVAPTQAFLRVIDGLPFECYL